MTHSVPPSPQRSAQKFLYECLLPRPGSNSQASSADQVSCPGVLFAVREQRWKDDDERKELFSCIARDLQQSHPDQPLALFTGKKRTVVELSLREDRVWDYVYTDAEGTSHSCTADLSTQPADVEERRLLQNVAVNVHCLSVRALEDVSAISTVMRTLEALLDFLSSSLARMWHAIKGSAWRLAKKEYSEKLEDSEFRKAQTFARTFQPVEHHRIGQLGHAEVLEHVAFMGRVFQSEARHEPFIDSQVDAPSATLRVDVGGQIAHFECVDAGDCYLVAMERDMQYDSTLVDAHDREVPDQSHPPLGAKPRGWGWKSQDPDGRSTWVRPTPEQLDRHGRLMQPLVELVDLPGSKLNDLIIHDPQREALDRGIGITNSNSKYSSQALSPDLERYFETQVNGQTYRLRRLQGEAQVSVTSQTTNGANSSISLKACNVWLKIPKSHGFCTTRAEDAQGQIQTYGRSRAAAVAQILEEGYQLGQRVSQTKALSAAKENEKLVAAISRNIRQGKTFLLPLSVGEFQDAATHFLLFTKEKRRGVERHILKHLCLVTKAGQTQREHVLTSYDITGKGTEDCENFVRALLKQQSSSSSTKAQKKVGPEVSETSLPRLLEQYGVCEFEDVKAKKIKPSRDPVKALFLLAQDLQANTQRSQSIGSRDQDDLEVMTESKARFYSMYIRHVLDDYEKHAMKFSVGQKEQVLRGLQWYAKKLEQYAKAEFGSAASSIVTKDLQDSIEAILQNLERAKAKEAKAHEDLNQAVSPSRFVLDDRLNLEADLLDPKKEGVFVYERGGSVSTDAKRLVKAFAEELGARHQSDNLDPGALAIVVASQSSDRAEQQSLESEVKHLTSVEQLLSRSRGLYEQAKALQLQPGKTQEAQKLLRQSRFFYEAAQRRQKENFGRKFSGDLHQIRVLEGQIEDKRKKIATTPGLAAVDKEQLETEILQNQQELVKLYQALYFRSRAVLCEQWYQQRINRININLDALLGEEAHLLNRQERVQDVLEQARRAVREIAELEAAQARLLGDLDGIQHRIRQTEARQELLLQELAASRAIEVESEQELDIYAQLLRSTKTEQRLRVEIQSLSEEIAAQKEAFASDPRYQRAALAGITREQRGIRDQEQRRETEAIQRKEARFRGLGQELERLLDQRTQLLTLLSAPQARRCQVKLELEVTIAIAIQSVSQDKLRIEEELEGVRHNLERHQHLAMHERTAQEEGDSISAALQGIRARKLALLQDEKKEEGVSKGIQSFLLRAAGSLTSDPTRWRFVESEESASFQDLGMPAGFSEAKVRLYRQWLAQVEALEHSYVEGKRAVQTGTPSAVVSVDLEYARRMLGASFGAYHVFVEETSFAGAEERLGQACQNPCSVDALFARIQANESAFKESAASLVQSLSQQEANTDRACQQLQQLLNVAESRIVKKDFKAAKLLLLDCMKALPLEADSSCWTNLKEEQLEIWCKALYSLYEKMFEAVLRSGDYPLSPREEIELNVALPLLYRSLFLKLQGVRQQKFKDFIDGYNVFTHYAKLEEHRLKFLEIRTKEIEEETKKACKDRWEQEDRKYAKDVTDHKRDVSNASKRLEENRKKIVEAQASIEAHQKEILRLQAIVSPTAKQQQEIGRLQAAMQGWVQEKARCTTVIGQAQADLDGATTALETTKTTYQTRKSTREAELREAVKRAVEEDPFMIRLKAFRVEELGQVGFWERCKTGEILGKFAAVMGHFAKVMGISSELMAFHFSSNVFQRGVPEETLKEVLLLEKDGSILAGTSPQFDKRYQSCHALFKYLYGLEDYASEQFKTAFLQTFVIGFNNPADKFTYSVEDGVANDIQLKLERRQQGCFNTAEQGLNSLVCFQTSNITKMDRGRRFFRGEAKLVSSRDVFDEDVRRTLRGMDRVYLVAHSGGEFRISSSATQTGGKIGFVLHDELVEEKRAKAGDRVSHMGGQLSQQVLGHSTLADGEREEIHAAFSKSQKRNGHGRLYPSITSEQEAVLRITDLGSSVSVKELFQYLYQYPATLEKEDIQQSLYKRMFQPGWLREQIFIDPQFFIDLAPRLHEICEYYKDDPRITLFIRHLASRICIQAEDLIQERHFDPNKRKRGYLSHSFSEEKEQALQQVVRVVQQHVPYNFAHTVALLQTTLNEDAAAHEVVEREDQKKKVSLHERQKLYALYALDYYRLHEPIEISDCAMLLKAYYVLLRNDVQVGHGGLIQEVKAAFLGHFLPNIAERIRHHEQDRKELFYQLLGEPLDRQWVSDASVEYVYKSFGLNSIEVDLSTGKGIPVHLIHADRMLIPLEIYESTVYKALFGLGSKYRDERFIVKKLEVPSEHIKNYVVVIDGKEFVFCHNTQLHTVKILQRWEGKTYQYCQHVQFAGMDSVNLEANPQDACFSLFERYENPFIATLAEKHGLWVPYNERRKKHETSEVVLPFTSPYDLNTDTFTLCIEGNEITEVTQGKGKAKRWLCSGASNQDSQFLTAISGQDILILSEPGNPRRAGLIRFAGVRGFAYQVQKQDAGNSQGVKLEDFPTIRRHPKNPQQWAIHGNEDFVLQLADNSTYERLFGKKWREFVLPFKDVNTGREIFWVMPYPIKGYPKHGQVVDFLRTPLDYFDACVPIMRTVGAVMGAGEEVEGQQIEVVRASLSVLQRYVSKERTREMIRVKLPQKYHSLLDGLTAPSPLVYSSNEKGELIASHAGLFYMVWLAFENRDWVQASYFLDRMLDKGRFAAKEEMIEQELECFKNLLVPFFVIKNTQIISALFSDRKTCSAEERTFYLRLLLCLKSVEIEARVLFTDFSMLPQSVVELLKQNHGQIKPEILLDLFIVCGYAKHQTEKGSRETKTLSLSQGEIELIQRLPGLEIKLDIVGIVLNHLLDPMVREMFQPRLQAVKDLPKPQMKALKQVLELLTEADACSVQRTTFTKERQLQEQLQKLPPELAQMLGLARMFAAGQGIFEKFRILVDLLENNPLEFRFDVACILMQQKLAESSEVISEAQFKEFVGLLFSKTSLSPAAQQRLQTALVSGIQPTDRKALVDRLGATKAITELAEALEGKGEKEPISLKDQFQVPEDEDIEVMLQAMAKCSNPGRGDIKSLDALHVQYGSSPTWETVLAHFWDYVAVILKGEIYHAAAELDDEGALLGQARSQTAIWLEDLSFLTRDIPANAKWAKEVDTARRLLMVFWHFVHNKDALATFNPNADATRLFITYLLQGINEQRKALSGLGYMQSKLNAVLEDLADHPTVLNVMSALFCYLRLDRRQTQAVQDRKIQMGGETYSDRYDDNYSTLSKEVLSKFVNVVREGLRNVRTLEYFSIADKHPDGYVPPFAFGDQVDATAAPLAAGPAGLAAAVAPAVGLPPPALQPQRVQRAAPVVALPVQYEKITIQPSKCRVDVEQFFQNEDVNGDWNAQLEAKQPQIRAFFGDDRGRNISQKEELRNIREQVDLSLEELKERTQHSCTVEQLGGLQVELERHIAALSLQKEELKDKLLDYIAAHKDHLGIHYELDEKAKLSQLLDLYTAGRLTGCSNPALRCQIASDITQYLLVEAQRIQYQAALKSCAELQSLVPTLHQVVRAQNRRWFGGGQVAGALQNAANMSSDWRLYSARLRQSLDLGSDYLRYVSQGEEVLADNPADEGVCVDDIEYKVDQKFMRRYLRLDVEFNITRPQAAQALQALLWDIKAKVEGKASTATRLALLRVGAGKTSMIFPTIADIVLADGLRPMLITDEPLVRQLQEELFNKSIPTFVFNFDINFGIGKGLLRPKEEEVLQGFDNARARQARIQQGLAKERERRAHNHQIIMDHLKGLKLALDPKIKKRAILTSPNSYASLINTRKMLIKELIEETHPDTKAELFAQLEAVREIEGFLNDLAIMRFVDEESNLNIHFENNFASGEYSQLDPIFINVAEALFRSIHAHSQFGEFGCELWNAVIYNNLRSISDVKAALKPVARDLLRNKEFWEMLPGWSEEVWNNMLRTAEKEEEVLDYLLDAETDTDEAKPRPAHMPDFEAGLPEGSYLHHLSALRILLSQTFKTTMATNPDLERGLFRTEPNAQESSLDQPQKAKQTGSTAVDLLVMPYTQGKEKVGFRFGKEDEALLHQLFYSMGVGHLFSKQFFCDHFHNRLEELANIRISPFYEETWQSWKAKILKIAAQEYPEDSDGAYKAFISSPALVLQRLQLQRYLLTQTHCIGIYKEQLRTPAQDLTFGLYDKDNVRVTSGTGNATTLNCYNLSDEDDLESSVHGVGSFFETVACMQNLDESVEIFEEGALEYMQKAAQRPCPPSALINTDYQVLEGNTAALVTALSKSRSDATYVYCDSATREKQMLYPNHSTPLPYAREGVRGVSINVYGPDDTRGVDLYIPSGKDRYGICLIGMGIQEDALAQAIGRMRGFFNLGQHVKFAFDRHTADKIRAVCRLGDDEPIVSGHVMLCAALNTVQERFLGHTKAFVYQAQQPLRELVHNVLATPLQIPADYERDVAESFEREVLFPVFKDYVVETLKTNWAAEYNPHEKLKPVDFMLHLYDAELAKIEEHCQKLLREAALFAKGLYEEKTGRVLVFPLSGALWDAVPLPFKEEMFKNFPKLKILLDEMEKARQELLKRRALLTEAHPTQGGDSAYKEYVESKLPERITTNSASKVGTQVKQQQQMQQQMQQRQLAQVKTEVEQQMEMHLTVPADGYRQCLNLAQFIEQARPGRSDTHGHYFSLTALAHEYACISTAATTEIQAMALRMRVPAFLNRATNSNMYISRRAESVFSYTQGQPLPDLYILVIRLSDGSYRSVLITPTEFEELEQLDENEDGVIGFKKLRNLQNYSVSVYSLQNQELSSFPLLHVTSLDDITTIRENDPVFLNLMVMNHLLLHWTQFSSRQFNFLYDVVDRYPTEAEHLIQALGGDVQSDRVKKLLKTLLKREELTQEDRELYLAFATRKLNQDFPLDDGPYGRYLEIEKACLLHHYRKQPNALKADIVYHQSQSHANSVRCLEELQTAMNLETQRELLLAMLKDCAEGQLEERIRVYISTQPILSRLNDGIRGQFAREVLEQARQQKRVFAIFGKLDQNLALRAYAEIELVEIARWFSNRTLDLQDKMVEHQGNAQSLAVLQEIKTRVCCHHGLQIREICNGPLEQRLARLSTYFAQLGLSENAEILNFLITEYVLWPRLLELTYTPHRAENHYRLQPLEFNFLCKVLEKYPQAAAHAIETLGSSKERLKAEVETTSAASGRSRAQVAVQYLQIFVKPVAAWQTADMMVFVYFAEDKLIANIPMTAYSDKELEALYLYYEDYYRSSLTGITISHTQLDRLHSAQVLQNVEARIAGKEFLEQRKAVVMRELERGSSTSAWLYKTDDEFYKKLDELMVRQGMHMRRGCQETREEIINTCLIKVRAARAMKKLEQNSAREAFTPDEINALAYHTYFSEVTQLEVIKNLHARYQATLSFRVFQDVYKILQDHHRQKMTEECALLRAQGRDDREIQTSLNDYKLAHNLPESWVADLRPVIA